MTKVTSNRKHIIKNTVVRKVQTDCIELMISSFTFLRWSKTNSQAINVVISGNLLGSFWVVGRSVEAFAVQQLFIGGTVSLMYSCRIWFLTDWGLCYPWLGSMYIVWGQVILMYSCRSPVSRYSVVTMQYSAYTSLYSALVLGIIVL